jgi:Arylsulfotransferase (ASST)/Immunoglobulin domain
MASSHTFKSFALGLMLLAFASTARSGSAPSVTITQTSYQVAPGSIFITPSPTKAQQAAGASAGPEILDNQGRPVWFLPLPAGQTAAGFQVQTYQGNPVLTWSQGPGFQGLTPGATTDYICDTSYNVIATVQAGNGLNADLHAFQLTPQGKALITIYHNVPMDLSPYGGPANGTVLEGVVQEIDVSTGEVLLEWHSLDHVSLTESHMPVPSNGVYDYFHINWVTLDTDGNLLISSRHTWTIYKVDRSSGAVIWRMGGKLSDFTFGNGLPFAWQHDAVAIDSSTIRIFDNESDGIAVLPASRAIWIRHDDSSMTVTLLKSVQHPSGLSAAAEGSAQDLPNGDTFVNWGILGRFSEFDSGGNLIFDASLPKGCSTYQAYRFPWTGRPSASPTLLATLNPDSTISVHAVWNGATAVASWTVLGGDTPDLLSPVATVSWNGLDTQTVIPVPYNYLQVIANDILGSPLDSSEIVPVPPLIVSQPASQLIATGSSAVFHVASAAQAPTYQWFLDGIALADGPTGQVTLYGSASQTLLIEGADSTAAGAYTCVVTDDAGSVTSQPAVLEVSDTQDPGRLLNLSARSFVGNGGNALAIGFVVGGGQASGTQNLLIRASGPALEGLGITDCLPDPAMQITTFTTSGRQSRVVASWGGNSLIAQAAAFVGAFTWTDPTSLDSAVMGQFAAAANTAQVYGSSGDTGVALAEIYDATPPGTYTPASPRLVNVSARASVGTGTGILVAGFVIGGSTSKTVLIRASGPALSTLGVSGVLPDPQLQLYSGATLLTSSGPWNGDAVIASVAQAVGAFAWTDPGSSDAALLVTLPPGAYTASVSGITGDTGVALVEVYEVP